MLESTLNDLTMLAIPGEFRSAHGEWTAMLPDDTEIVVADALGRPCGLGIQKAIAIVQSRTGLETRARQLLAPLGKIDGKWRLVALDFGIQARNRDCEFLMCFAFQAANPDPAVADPYVEVGFALSSEPTGAGVGPLFILMIQTMAGFAA